MKTAVFLAALGTAASASELRTGKYRISDGCEANVTQVGEQLYDVKVRQKDSPVVASFQVDTAKKNITSGPDQCDGKGMPKPTVKVVDFPDSTYYFAECGGTFQPVESDLSFIVDA